MKEGRGQRVERREYNHRTWNLSWEKRRRHDGQWGKQGIVGPSGAKSELALVRGASSAN